MSATVDCSLFSNYFSILINGKKEGAPIIQVDGKMFDVAEYYFEDISGLSEVSGIYYQGLVIRSIRVKGIYFCMFIFFLVISFTLYSCLIYPIILFC